MPRLILLAVSLLIRVQSVWRKLVAKLISSALLGLTGGLQSNLSHGYWRRCGGSPYPLVSYRAWQTCKAGEMFKEPGAEMYVLSSFLQRYMVLFVH